jgi:hypothetical protein
MGSGDLNVFTRKPQVGENPANAATMIALENDPIALEGTAARAYGFKRVGDCIHVKSLIIHALDNGDGTPPLSVLYMNLDPLLLLAYGATDANILWKPACWANLNHVFYQKLLDGLCSLSVNRFLLPFILLVFCFQTAVRDAQRLKKPV